MVKKSVVLAGLAMVFGLVAVAANLSGSLSTTFTFGNTLTAWNNLALRLSFSSVELRSLSIWHGLHLAEQAFAISGNFGNLGIHGGVVLKPLAELRLGVWSAQEFQVAASFFALELRLGNLRLRFVFQVGPAEP